MSIANGEGDHEVVEGFFSQAPPLEAQNPSVSTLWRRSTSPPLRDREETEAASDRVVSVSDA
jgi:hypothetical protein